MQKYVIFAFKHKGGIHVLTISTNYGNIFMHGGISGIALSLF